MKRESLQWTSGRWRHDQRGMLIVLLEETLATLNRANADIRQHWLKINDENKHKTQVALLMQRQEARVRELQAGLLDGNGELQKILSLLQFEFKEMGLPAPSATPVTALPEPVRTVPDSQDKKSKWFS
jgi:hypothetical protein